MSEKSGLKVQKGAFSNKNSGEKRKCVVCSSCSYAKMLTSQAAPVRLRCILFGPGKNVSITSPPIFHFVSDYLNQESMTWIVL